MRGPSKGVESALIRLRSRLAALHLRLSREIARLETYSRGRWTALGLPAVGSCILVPGDVYMRPLLLASCVAQNGRRPSKRAVVCHRCDEPRCVNGPHLFWGTQSDNVRDCIVKGRAPGKSRADTPERLGALRGRRAGVEKKMVVIDLLLSLPREGKAGYAEWDLLVARAFGWDESRFRRRVERQKEGK